MKRGRSTRRELLAGAVVSAAGLAALPDPGFADSPPTDSEVLSTVLEVERLVVLAYRRALASGALGAGEAFVVRTQLGHELEHVSTLDSRLSALGSPAPAGPLDVETGEAMLSKHNIPGSLTDLHTRHDCLRLLVDVESLAEGAYFTALKTLGSVELVRLSVQAMGCEAQHWTVLSGLRNPGQYVKSVPWPFVTGSS